MAHVRLDGIGLLVLGRILLGLSQSLEQLGSRLGGGSAGEVTARTSVQQLHQLGVSEVQQLVNLIAAVEEAAEGDLQRANAATATAAASNATRQQTKQEEGRQQRGRSNGQRGCSKSESNRAQCSSGSGTREQARAEQTAAVTDESAARAAAMRGAIADTCKRFHEQVHLHGALLRVVDAALACVCSLLRPLLLSVLSLRLRLPCVLLFRVVPCPVPAPPRRRCQRSRAQQTNRHTHSRAGSSSSGEARRPTAQQRCEQRNRRACSECGIMRASSVVLASYHVCMVRGNTGSTSEAQSKGRIPTRWS